MFWDFQFADLKKKENEEKKNQKMIRNLRSITIY